MISATVSSKFRISIPKKLREILHIKIGQQFIFVPYGKSIQLVPKQSINEIRGILTEADNTNFRDREDRHK